jgi:hypothetical protein
MSGLKATIWLIAAITVLSIGVVLYPQSPANAAAYCAQYSGTAGGGPNCTFATIKDCRAAVKAKGGGRCYKKKGT